MAQAVQAVLDTWDQDEEGWDEEFGFGGACDAISNAISELINMEGVEVLEGGHDGDDHSWIVVYDDKEAFDVDVPPSVYETGGGYSWRKTKDATVSPEDVIIYPVKRSDIVASRTPMVSSDMPKNVSPLAQRVAARYIRSLEERTALPKSGPGQNMVKGILEKMQDAFDHGDEEKFKKLYENLGRAAKV